MKVGILTHFHKSTNYGGVLQAYALCRYLNDSGYDARQILYTHVSSPITPQRMTVKLFFEKVLSRIERRVYDKKNRAIRARMESSFFDFRDAVFHTEEEYTSETISQVKNDFDAFIVGSDQVWNPVWYDSAYMLDFVYDGARKISYAASMGVGSLNEREALVFKSKLSDFDAISVRESVAGEVISKAIDRPVCVTVDPTLLLSAEDWDSVATDRKIDSPYVFAYFLGEDKKTRSLAERFAERNGLKLVVIPHLLGSYRKCDRKLKADFVEDASPRDFISLIKNAEYVFTDSFHASVFSLVYEKKFFVFHRGGKIKMGSRIRNLLQLFACEERFIETDNGAMDRLMRLVDVDLKVDRKAFEEERRHSIEFLKSSLA